ncbi:hypothetical protein EDC04DRAFT_2617850 [Pisolithus marmoratus]|nr:hypothetical protein EDC04DRAFT_2617850 [Pisolithus marmoratus]
MNSEQAASNIGELDDHRRPVLASPPEAVTEYAAMEEFGRRETPTEDITNAGHEKITFADTGSAWTFPRVGLEDPQHATLIRLQDSANLFRRLIPSITGDYRRLAQYAPSPAPPRRHWGHSYKWTPSVAASHVPGAENCYVINLKKHVATDDDKGDEGRNLFRRLVCTQDANANAGDRDQISRAADAGYLGQFAEEPTMDVQVLGDVYDPSLSRRIAVRGSRPNSNYTT